MFGGSEFGFPSANINVAGLALSGAIVFGSVVILPLIVKAYVAQHPDQHYAKILETTRFGSDGLLHLATGMLGKGEYFHGCVLKLACLTARETYMEEPTEIFQQLSSNSLLSSMLNSTALEDAFRGGKEGRQCESHHSCPIKDEHMRSFLRNIAALGKR